MVIVILRIAVNKALLFSHLFHLFCLNAETEDKVKPCVLRILGDNAVIFKHSSQFLYFWKLMQTKWCRLVIRWKEGYVQHSSNYSGTDALLRPSHLNSRVFQCVRSQPHTESTSILVKVSVLALSQIVSQACFTAANIHSIAPHKVFPPFNSGHQRKPYCYRTIFITTNIFLGKM